MSELKNKIQKKIKQFEKEIKKIEIKGHGLQWNNGKYERICNKLFCKDCHEVGELYIKSNLLKEILK